VKVGQVAQRRPGSKGKPTFINFDKPYPNQDFTVMIWDDDWAGFGNLSRCTSEEVLLAWHHYRVPRQAGDGSA
jgi:hypothetical protein